jgi:hypothetical protein
VRFEADQAHLELSPVGEVFEYGIAVGLWVRPAALVEGEVHLVGDGGGGITSFQLVLEDGVPVFRLADANNQWNDLLRATDALEHDDRHYVQVVYDVGAGSMFIDGDEVATTRLVYPIQGSHNIVYVGARTSFDDPDYALGYGFVGDLDEIAIYSGNAPP